MATFDPTVLTHVERTTPGKSLREITASDATTYTPYLRALYIGTGGDVAVLAVGDIDAVTIPDVPSGTILPISVTKVMATNTTATGIIGIR